MYIGTYPPLPDPSQEIVDKTYWQNLNLRGRYEDTEIDIIDEVIDSGNFNDVYRAYDRFKNFNLVVKIAKDVMSPDDEGKKEALEKYKT